MPEQLAQPGIDKDSPFAEVNEDSKLELGNENGTEKETIPTLNNSKKFKLKHIFKKVSTLEDGKIMKSPTEEHFGLPWRLSINRCNGYIHVKARCLEHRENNDWAMELIPTINALTENQKYICSIKKLPILGTKSKVTKMSTRQQKAIEDLHNEVESLRNEMAEIKKNLEESVKNEKENGRKRKGEEDGGSSSAKKPAPEKSPFLAKHFVIKHKWENLLEMKEGETRTSPEEENFGLTCGMEIVRRDDNFETRYFCRKPLLKNDTVHFLWVVKGTLSKSGSVFKHYGNSGTEWSHSFKATELTDWEEKMKMNNGSSYDVEVNFYFKRTSGFYKENLKDFDETMEKFADVVIIVQGQKFFVSNFSMERQTRQQKVIDDIKNDLEGLRSEMAEIKKKQEEDLENRKKRKVDETDNSKDEPAKKFSMPQKQPTLPLYSAKSFKLKHTFDKISTLQENETRMSPIDEHFGVNWILKICRSNGYIQFNFECQEPPGISYTVETNMKIMFGIGRYYYCYEKLLLGGLCRGFQNRSFIKWDTRNESRYIDNDTLLVKRRIMPVFKTLSDVQCINPKDLDDLDKDSAIDLLRKVINSK
ncbi:hypothetical protein CAEBREN_09523 [Caenorhabditis brenneri]|uniref:MATH domain-containing protein n=1 Tax=Caenorhabditis brenneri TaxID=135651 RepID=G0MCS5_CAEBE|nr:hypothetical protein CAEBREN_09523 [Caenorhabditis brenneri]